MVACRIFWCCSCRGLLDFLDVLVWNCGHGKHCDLGRGVPVLQGCKRCGPHKLMQGKAEVILLLSKDVDIKVVAEMVERQPSTIRTWVRAWQGSRLASIHTGHEGNLDASKLTAQQRNEVVAVLRQPPGDEGLPVEYRTRLERSKTPHQQPPTRHLRRHPPRLRNLHPKQQIPLSPQQERL